MVLLLRRALVAMLLLLAASSVEARRRKPKFPIGEEEWRKEVSSLGLEPESVIYPFATSPEMDAWVEAFLHRYGRVLPLDRLRMLQYALFDQNEFQFRYEQPVNLTGAEAFAQRRGNCMAFTAMFITLSRQMGVETFLVSVAREPPRVEMENGLVVVSRHVVAGYSYGGTLYLYDFYLASEVPYTSRRAIDDVKASAVFHTNLGGTAIREGDLEQARQHLEVATRLDPALASAWVNLGVVRFRSGDPRGALEAYERALRCDPGHSSALTNMAYVYQQQGKTEESRAALRAAAEGRSSPFTLIALADVEAARGEYDLARGFLRRARRLYRKVPEVYDAFARLEGRAGDPLVAERYERKAEKLRRKIREEREAQLGVPIPSTPADGGGTDLRAGG